MNFYKILNKKENHNFLQYKTGLNIDPVEFNPSGNCEPGGIYFASKDILAFIDYGPWIRKVTLPKDARVYKNPGSPEKWKANKVILGRKYKITAKVIKRLIDEGADPKVNDIRTLQWAAENGYFEIVKALIDNRADPKANYNHALQLAIENNHLKIIKLLIPFLDLNKNSGYLLSGAAGNGHIETVKLLIPILKSKIYNSYALQMAAENGHLNIVKLLLNSGADPKARNNYALKWSAMNGHLKIVKLLIPVSNITENTKTWIRLYCDNQKIKNLILNYKRKNLK